MNNEDEDDGAGWYQYQLKQEYRELIENKLEDEPIDNNTKI
jgi:hypothetical protein